MGTLVMMHFPSDTGFALRALERIFFAAAREIEADERAIHFSYSRIQGGGAAGLPPRFANLIEYDLQRPESGDVARLGALLRRHRIERALAFDLAPGNPTHRLLRAGGVRRIVSYLGAPMGTPVRGWRRLAKQLQVALQSQADHYVFESRAMQETGIDGRGLAAAKTSVVVTGLDLERFRPDVPGSAEAFASLGIPAGRDVVFYSGHMEPRKGVAVIVEAAVELVDRRGHESVHFLLCGDRPGEADSLRNRLRATRAAGHVTFGGYRDDIPVLLAGARLGVIASTGWDSFPRAAMEMSAAGLPLVASALQGLVEAVVPGETGALFRPGDAVELATIVAELLADEPLRSRLGRQSRRMAVERYSERRQIVELAQILAPELRASSA
jgi:glycosyltransferase involved in cell wall biosynthesis